MQQTLESGRLTRNQYLQVVLSFGWCVRNAERVNLGGCGSALRSTGLRFQQGRMEQHMPQLCAWVLADGEPRAGHVICICASGRRTLTGPMRPEPEWQRLVTFKRQRLKDPGPTLIDNKTGCVALAYTARLRVIGPCHLRKTPGPDEALDVWLITLSKKQELKANKNSPLAHVAHIQDSGFCEQLLRCLLMS